MHDVAANTPVTESSIIDLLSSPSLQAHRQIVEAGAVLCNPEEPSTSVHFIESGQVRVYQMGPGTEGRLLEILGPNDWFGIAALAGQSKQGTRAIAVSRSVVWTVPADQLMAALPSRPVAAIDLVKQLATKFQNALDEASELVFDDCNSRLIKTLIRFSSSVAASPNEDGVVLRITHEQLAQAVGVARETVSLALTQLRRQNLLRTGRNQLFFDPAALRTFACRVNNGQKQREPSHS